MNKLRLFATGLGVGSIWLAQEAEEYERYRGRLSETLSATWRRILPILA